MDRAEETRIGIMTERAIELAYLYKWSGLQHYYNKYIKVAERLVLWRCQRLKRKFNGNL